MDEIQVKSKYLQRLLLPITVTLVSLFLIGCLPCEPYLGRARCYHWIPPHYKGDCFVPGHCDGFVGTGAFGTRPMMDNFQTTCRDSRISINNCGNYWQSGCCFKQQCCCSFRDHGWRWPHEWWQSILCAYKIH